MTTYNTGNPIGSTDPRDLYDNAENLDEAVNTRTAESWDDRFGVARKTWWGMEQDFQDFLINSGYENIGDYGPGLEITARNQIFWRDGELYRAGDVLDLPYTTTGDWGEEEELFVAVGDASLRQELTSQDVNEGAGLVARSSITVSAIEEIKQVTPDGNRVVNLTANGRQGSFVWIEGDFSSELAADEFEAVYIASGVAGASGAWVREGDWRETGVMVSWFGFLPGIENTIQAATTTGGVGDWQVDIGPFQKAYDFCVDQGLTFVVDQHYWIDSYLMNKSGARVRFIPGKGRLIAAVSEPVLGGFFTGDFSDGITAGPLPVTDLVVWDLDIDCNKMAAMNGLAIPVLTKARFHGATTVRNTLHSTTFLGGRAVGLEGGVCEDIHVDELYIEDCSIGISSQALPANYIAKNISYGKVVMNRVGSPFGIHCTDDGSEAMNVNRMSTTVGLAVLSNCGRPDWLASGERYQGGIITGDRGSGLYIADLRVVNDDSYGLVGGLFKGTMYGVTVGHADIYGSFNNLCDFNYLPYDGSVSHQSLPSWVDANITFRGGFSHIVELLNTSAGGNSLGSCRITLKAKPSQITRICNANLGIYSNSQIILINADTGKEYPARTPRQFISYGNDFAGAVGYQTVSCVRLDTDSGQPRTFFSIPVPVNGRASVQITATAIAVSSSTTAALTSVLALIAIVRDGGGALSSSVSTAPLTVSVLDGYASNTLSFSVSDIGGGNVSIDISQVNDVGVNMAVFAEAKILEALATGPIQIIESPVF